MILGAITKHDSAGVTSLKLHRILDIITADGGGIKINGSLLAAAELGYIDGVTAGTAAVSKALVLDSMGTVNFASITPAYTDDDDAFLAIGTYNSAMTVADTGKSFIPIQVNLSSTGNLAAAGDQVAAMRLRVDTDTNHQANTAISCLQLRSDLAKNCYAATGISGSTNISANISLPTASLQGIYYQVTGAGAVTCPNEPNVMEIGYHQSSGGAGFNSVARFDCNATGCSITNILRLQNYAGTVTNALLIDGAYTNGINISGAITKGLSIEVTTTASGRVEYLNGTVAAPTLSDGYGFLERQVTVTGTATGSFAVASTWVNFNANSSAGANIIYIHNDGFYASATGTPCSTATLIGHRYQFDCSNLQPAAAYLFSVNPYNISLNAIFYGNDKADFGWVTGTLSSGTASHFPLYKVGSVTHYVNTFTA